MPRPSSKTQLTLTGALFLLLLSMGAGLLWLSRTGEDTFEVPTHLAPPVSEVNTSPDQVIAEEINSAPVGVDLALQSAQAKAADEAFQAVPSEDSNEPLAESGQVVSDEAISIASATPIPTSQTRPQAVAVVNTPTPKPSATPLMPPSEPLVQSVSQETVPNTVVITFASDASPQEQAEYIAALAGTVSQEIDALNTVVVEVPAAIAAQPLPESDIVTVSEPDYLVSALLEPPSDPLYSQQWSMPAIGAPDAWAALPVDAPQITVAVIDSGVCEDADLQGRVLTTGFDYVDNDTDPDDTFGHGCAVTGVIAANTNNGVGIAGVAPNAMILPIRVLDSNGVGSYSNVAAGIVYAVDNGAQIINLSLGGASPSTVLENAINYAVTQDVIVVAAAGNTGTEGVLYPARYAPVIAVGSVDQNLQRSSFSTTGSEVDILAPGRNILVLGLDGTSRIMSGTSFAAPHVAALAAVESVLQQELTLDGGIIHFAGNQNAGDSTPIPTPKPSSILSSIPLDETKFNFRQITIKFNEGTAVRLRATGLTSLSGADLSSFDALLATQPNAQIERLFTRPESDIEQERALASAASGVPLPDLNLYYAILLPQVTTLNDAVQFINSLNALPSVQIAYPEPIYQPAVVDIPPTTPLYSTSQDYFDPAPSGIDVGAAWAVTGGKGSNVKVVDIEQGWRLDHEDLNIQLLSGTNYTETAYIEHGTAVLGEVVGVENGYGITGIAPQAQGYAVSTMGNSSWPNVANAINIAASSINAGDIIIYEMHAQGPSSGLDPNSSCNPSQFELIAMEYWQANFDATLVATASGRIVIEAAGNGSMDFDDARYGGAFNRSIRDSGAIMIGAGTSYGGLAPTCWTNYGSRIDVHGWGENIVTTGYGDLFNGSGDVRQYYTYTFGGTSGASPIVAGAAVVLQGIARQRGTVLTPAQMRQILRDTGTPQASSPKQIGPLPDLEAAIGQIGTISGTVYATNGVTRLANVNVGIDNTMIGTCTDANGNYTLYNVPSDVEYKVHAGGSGNWCAGGSTYYMQEYWQETSNSDTATPITLTSGSPNRTAINFTLTLGGKITGTIYQANGITPITSNAGISIDEYNTNNWIAGAGVNADGTYSALIPAGTYRVRASGTGYALEFYNNAGANGSNANPVNVSAGATTSNINFSLDAGGSISGTVYASDGVTPLANMPVSVDAVWVGGCTNSLGQYTLNNVPLNTAHKVFAGGGNNWCAGGANNYLREYWENTPDWSAATPITLTSGNPSRSGINFTLVAGGAITGRLYEGNGTTPLNNGWVNVHTADTYEMVSETSVAADGTYTIAVAPGTYVVSAAANNRAIEYYNNAGPAPDNANTVNVTVGNTTSGINFSLDPGGSISGTVYAANGTTPLANMNVGVNGAWVGACTDANGQFTIFNVPQNLPWKVFSGGVGNWCGGPNIYSEEYWQEAQFENATAITLTSGQPNRTGINFTLAIGAQIKGYVYEADGITPVTANVAWGWAQAEDAQGIGYGSTSVAADGSYTMLVPPGTYRLVAGAENRTMEYYNNAGANLLDGTLVTISSGQTLTGYNFTLDMGGVISGTVYAANGITPLSNISVGLEGKTIRVCTDANGHYELMFVPLNQSLKIWAGGTPWFNCGSDSGNHYREWWQEATSAGVATPITLTSGSPTLTNINFTLGRMQMWVDAPAQSSTVRTTFSVGGWAINSAAGNGNGPGIDLVRVYQGNACSGTQLGQGTPNFPRSDVQTGMGLDVSYRNSGYYFPVLAPTTGSLTFTVCSRSSISGQFEAQVTRTVTAEVNALLWLDAPANSATLDSKTFNVGGWTLDPRQGNGAGVGIDQIQVYAGAACSGNLLGQGTPQFARADVLTGLSTAGINLDASYTNSGYFFPVTSNINGNLTFTVCAKRGGVVQAQETRTVTINGGQMFVDGPAANVGSSRVDLQACKLEYSIVSPK